ncbi:MAG: molybdate ABC transporter permease subunit [Chloroflexota bacterium]|nr:molybdate ABC transporter permease subunit [Chloroflexota bacterium]MDE2884420.1 molybdate ABC transporter permease subunit [Chloroflexota bacterium]
MDWDALRLSLQTGLASTALAFVVGIPVAWGLSRLRGWTHDLLSSSVLVPMVLPPTVLGYYLLVAVGRNSPVGSVLDALFGFSFVFQWSGAVLAAFFVSVPFLIRTAQAGFESVDHALEEAARTLGQTEWTVFTRITLPLAWRAVMTGVSLALARATGEFGATLMVAGSIPERTRTMPIAIYEAVLTGRTSEAQVLALTLTLTASGLLVAVAFGMRRRGPRSH